MKKINNIFWFIYLFIYLEIVYRIFIVKSFFTWETLQVILYTLPYALCCSLLISLFKNKTQRVLTIILSFIVNFLFTAQIVYFNFYNSMFSFYSVLKGTGQVFSFFEAIISSMLQIWYIILISFLSFLFYIIFSKKIIDYKRMNKKIYELFFFFFLFISSLSLLLIKLDNKDIYSKNNLYFNTHAPFLTVKKMGLITGEILDIKRYLFGFEEKGYFFYDNIEDYNAENYNVLDISFKKNNNSQINKINDYFTSVVPTKKNKYTGMFKDKNLILITAESFDTLGISEDLTPTLYKMTQSGFVFNNFYQPIYPISTSDGEYMNLTSLIPKEGTWSFYSSRNNSMPYSLANVFKKYDYSTDAYHNNSFDFYNRNLTHTNLGFSFKACGNGLETKINCNVWPESDMELIDATYNDYINNKKFLSYYMSVSTHMNYRKNNNYIVNKNYKYVSDLEYSENIKGYYATMIELDKSMENLINHLNDANKLDDTLIVIVPDHYPYGLSRKEMNEVSLFDKEDKYDIFKTTLIMYNSKMDTVNIDKVASGLDVLPTIYNLFGVEYDSRLFMGNDLLSNSEGLVILSNRSWITNKGKYDSIKEKYDGKENTDYVDKINKTIYNKFTISSMILDYDYYKTLEK